MVPGGGAGVHSWNSDRRDAQTGLYVGYVPGWPGAHSQGETVDELKRNLAEVISMLLEDGEPVLESEVVGTQTVQVG
jgi:predicted RNase H-like HicB family nuclease